MHVTDNYAPVVLYSQDVIAAVFRKKYILNLIRGI